MKSEPTTSLPSDEVAVSLQEHIGMVEIRRPPDNFFDVTLLDAVAEGFGRLVREPACRAIVLASAGNTFCAGAKFSASGPGGGSARSGSRLYVAALQLFRCPKPVIAAVQGPAVGGGLGLALVADFRVVAPEARFAANFVKLGIHPGFGITATLPRVVGRQRAALMLYTGRRIKAEEASAGDSPTCSSRRTRFAPPPLRSQPRSRKPRPGGAGHARDDAHGPCRADANADRT